MTAKEFVACWRQEMDDLVEAYMAGAISSSNSLEVAQQIVSLQLNPDQMGIMKKIIEGIITDAYYTVLLGLDGCASIGGIQQTYRIYDETDTLISECGDLEGEAWEQFHGHSERN